MKGRAVELHRRGASEGAADRDQLGKGELQHRRKLLRDEIATAIEIARQARAYGNAGIYGPFADAFPPMYDQWCRPIIGDASISLQKLIFQIIVAGVSAKHKIWNFIIDEIIETQYSNSNITMDTAEAIEAAAAILTRVFPAERVGKALEDLTAGGVSAGTDDRATAEPRPEGSNAQEVVEAAAETAQRRPKWKPDLGLTAAQFAAQAYAAEFASGTFDKSIIRRQDKTLYQLLYREKAWDELAALTKSPVPTKSRRRRTRKVEAVQAIGLPAEQAERVVATIEQEKPKSSNRPAHKARFG
jgi:hypothetical protein